MVDKMTAVQARAGSNEPPPIHISEQDYDRIAGMALRIRNSAPGLSRLILEEIERAVVYPAQDLPRNVVALGSEVEFVDDTNGTKRRVQLVLPGEADIEQGRISILTPVGAGLIGMSVGREISWPCPDGRARILKILEVEQQP
jgi:regulator of nucleoside diphosphate kinase